MKKNGKQILSASVLAAALVLLDQFSKFQAVHSLKGSGSLPLWKGVFELTYTENQGAAFGILQQQQLLFRILTIASLLLISWFFLFRIPAGRRFLPLNLCCLVLFSGALGNFLDRSRQGYVVDFFYFRLIDFPVFNLADCYITVSSICLILLLLFVYRDEELSDKSLKSERPKWKNFKFW